MRITKYQTLHGFVNDLNALASIPDPIVIVADHQHRAVWLNIKSAMVRAHEFEKRQGRDSKLDRVHLEVKLDDSEPGWYVESEKPSHPVKIVDTTSACQRCGMLRNCVCRFMAIDEDLPYYGKLLESGACVDADGTVTTDLSSIIALMRDCAFDDDFPHHSRTSPLDEDIEDIPPYTPPVEVHPATMLPLMQFLTAEIVREDNARCPYLNDHVLHVPGQERFEKFCRWQNEAREEFKARMITSLKDGTREFGAPWEVDPKLPAPLEKR